jgi:hypothetical protein
MLITAQVQQWSWAYLKTLTLEFVCEHQQERLFIICEPFFKMLLFQLTSEFLAGNEWFPAKVNTPNFYGLWFLLYYNIGLNSKWQFKAHKCAIDHFPVWDTN